MAGQMDRSYTLGKQVSYAGEFQEYVVGAGIGAVTKRLQTLLAASSKPFITLGQTIYAACVHYSNACAGMGRPRLSVFHSVTFLVQLIAQTRRSWRARPWTSCMGDYAWARLKHAGCEDASLNAAGH